MKVIPINCSHKCNIILFTHLYYLTLIGFAACVCVQVPFHVTKLRELLLASWPGTMVRSLSLDLEILRIFILNHKHKY